VWYDDDDDVDNDDDDDIDDDDNDDDVYLNKFRWIYGKSSYYHVLFN